MFSVELTSQEKDLARAGNKIDACRSLMKTHGFGVSVAKQVIDHFLNSDEERNERMIQAHNNLMDSLEADKKKVKVLANNDAVNGFEQILLNEIELHSKSTVPNPNAIDIAELVEMVSDIASKLRTD